MPRYRLVPEPDIFRCHALSRKARNGPPAPTREKQKNSPLQSRKFLCAQTNPSLRTKKSVLLQERKQLKYNIFRRTPTEARHAPT